MRGKGDEFENYLDVLDKSIRDAAKQCSMEYGDLEGVLRIRGVESRVNWPFVLYLFTAIGAQTLAIRGSEKSKYGKLFEKLVLGSLLTLLGFQRIDPGDTEKKQRVFWLSSRGKKRGLGLPGRAKKIHERVCRYGDHVPIRGVWRARTMTGAV